MAKYRKLIAILDYNGISDFYCNIEFNQHQSIIRGLIDIENLCKKQIALLQKYFHQKKHTSLLHDKVCQAHKNFTPLNVANEEIKNGDKSDNLDNSQQQA